MSSDLEWLMQWYYSQCDGNWEHGNGIRISTLDNPGWRLSVNLEETNLENKPFEQVEVERSEDDWFQCFIRDKKFEGPCGPLNLGEVLKVFRSWVEEE